MLSEVSKDNNYNALADVSQYKILKRMTTDIFNGNV